MSASPAASALTARRASLYSCHDCGLLSRIRPLPRGVHAHCARCGAKLHLRKPNSVARTAALVLAAAICYIPANVLPVMKVVSFGHGEADTIMSGVIVLFQGGQIPIAVLVLFASVTVPMLKLVGLTYLLITIKMKSRWRPKDRTVLYRLIEFVGRWSMLDMFMVSILVALVQLGKLATIEPGLGATFFAAVVVITMIAAASFDPRVMWDVIEEDDHARTQS